MDEESIIKKYFSKIGAKGGAAKSEAKRAANARNAKLPRIPDDQLTEAQRKRRERDARRKARLEAEKQAMQSDAD